MAKNNNLHKAKTAKNDEFLIMRYQGGKSRIAQQIAEIMQRERESSNCARGIYELLN